MIDLLQTLIENDLLIGLGYAIGTVLIGLFTIVGIWRKQIKPFIENKIVKPVKETNDQINHGQFQVVKAEVHEMKELLDKAKNTQGKIFDQLQEVKEDQAKNEGKIDVIIAYIATVRHGDHDND